MPFLRRLFVPAIAIAGCAIAAAQLEGPAPLAWRWAQSTTVPPGGNVVADGDTLIIAVGKRVYALDRLTGNQIWRFPVAEPLETNFRAGVAVVDGVVVAPNESKLVYGIDAKTGQSKWTYPAPAPIVGSPVGVGKNAVMALGDSSLTAVDVATGNQIWNNPQRVFDGLVGQIVGIRDAVVYATSINEMVSMDVVTTKVNWKTRFTLLSPDVKPVVFGEYFYVNTGDTLACLANANGRVRWQTNTRQQLSKNPAVTVDGVVVCTRDGLVLSYDLSGRPLARKSLDLGTIPVVDPALFGHVAAICTSNGSMNLVDIRTNTLLWDFIVRPMNEKPANSDDKTPNYVTAASPAVMVGKTVMVAGRDGSILAFDKEQGVDLTPPTVKMTFPQSGEQVNGTPPLLLVFQIKDDTSGLNLSSVKVAINDKPFEHTLTREGIAVVRMGEGKNPPLQDGRKKITVTASDWLGNTIVKEFALTVDNTLPKIKIPSNTTPPGQGGGGAGRGAGAG